MSDHGFGMRDVMNIDEVRRNLRRDLDQLRAPEGYLFAGSPRYRTLFGRDSLISAWQTLSIDPTIAKATLQVLALYQGRRFNARSEEEPGKILHEHRFDIESRNELPNWDFPYYGSIDSTLLYLIVAGEYAQRTGDRPLIDELWGAIEAAYRWMTQYGDKDGDGFLEYERANPHGLLHQGWKDGVDDHILVRPPVAIIEVQGYAVAAHRAYAALAEPRGEPIVGTRALAAASALQKALNRTFWMGDQHFYALALDEAKQVVQALLMAYEEMGRMPECYAVDGGTLVNLSTSSHNDVRANPLQAWASGALLDLVSDRRLMA